MAPQSTGSKATLSLTHISEKVWKGHPEEVEKFTDVFPDMPPGTVLLHSVQKLQRQELARRLQRKDADASAPLSTDPEAMLAAYNVKCGDTPVECEVNPDVLDRLHAERCPKCQGHAGAVVHPECYITKLSDIFRFGWLIDTADLPPHRPPRPRLDPDDRQALDEDLAADLKAGRVVEIPADEAVPLMSARFIVTKKVLARNDATAALEAGTVDIEDASLWRLKRRAVTHFTESGVNEHAAPWPSRMPAVDAAAELCTLGGYAACVDIRRGYPNIPLSKETMKYMCFEQQDASGKWRRYRYTRCSFGHRAFSGAFMALSGELHQIITHRGIPVATWVDDLLTAAPDKQTCQQQLDDIIAIITALGMTVAAEKVVAPTQMCGWLGLVIDLKLGRLAISRVRLAHIVAEARYCLDHRHACPVKKLQKLAGRMSFSTQAVPGSKAFVVALSAMAAIDKTAVTLSKLAVEDLEWWIREAANHNGSPAWLMRPDGTRSVHMASFMSDASGDVGYGAHTATEFIHGRWRADQQGKGVPYKELYGVFRMLGHMTGSRAGSGGEHTKQPVPRGSIIVVGSDAAGNCFRLNSGRAGDAGSDVITLLRRINQLSHDTGVGIVAIHIPRAANTVADRLTRATSHAQAARIFRTTPRPRMPATYDAPK